MIRQSHRTLEAYRVFIGQDQDFSTDGRAHPPDSAVSETVTEPALPNGHFSFFKHSITPDVTLSYASRYLSRFHEIIRRGSRGNLRLNEWTLHERITHDTVANSVGLLMQVVQRLRSLAFQISSPTGLVDISHPMSPEGESAALAKLDALCDELTRPPLPPPTTGRYPAILSSYVMSAILETLLPLLRSNSLLSFSLPEGWALVDDPCHPHSFQSVPIDAEGRRTRRQTIWKGERISPITDTVTARRRAIPATAHATRPTMDAPPMPNYHNLVLEGPEQSPENVHASWGKGLHLLRPIHVHFIEKHTRLQVIASAYGMEGDKIHSYYPLVTCRFTLRDFMRNLVSAVGPLSFTLDSCPLGVPPCYIHNLNIFS